MGVPGLWKELAPAAKVRSLTELAVVEGFEANPNGTRGFRIGIDASIWFFHAAYGKEGENPELRTMFFRCATLTHAPFLPLFVFDGPHRPNVKRGKKINRTSHTLTNGMKEIVESFGFEWRTCQAPGEAEAELAYLNRIGVLDGILSDDVDNFLFGATTVIRNASNNLSGNRANPVLNSEGRDDKNHTRVYRMADITTHPDVSLTRGDMILIGLCSGGDYDTSGMTGCGPGIAKGLVRYGFGRSLYEAAKNLPRSALPAFLHNWRNEIRYELRTDSKGYIGSKRRALASALPDAFPDIDILLSYTNPLTSESAGRARDNLKLTWGKEPDLGKLAATCEFYFEWGYRDSIIKRFKTVIWPGAVLRILRRGVLDLEAKRGGVHAQAMPSTPTRNGRPAPEGTPSKMIAKHFSSMTLNPVEDDEDDRLITKITRSRTHASTDGILEYRLEIRPRQLVLLAESGIKNTRRPLDADEWAGLTESGNEGGAEPVEELTEEERRAREEKEVMVWMPASMVRMAEPRLVEEFETLEEAKRLKKAGKGTKRKPKAKAVGSDEEELSDAVPKTKAPSKKVVRKAKAPILDEDEEAPKAKAKAPPKKAIRKTK
ncbi:PIN domain-like protein, partial [Mycena filopes]